MAKTRLFAVIVPILMSTLLLLGLSSVTGSNFDIPSAVDAQTTATSNTRTSTFEIDGQIGSLMLGMPPNTKKFDMTTAPKFILSENGIWT